MWLPAYECIVLLSIQSLTTQHHRHLIDPIEFTFQINRLAGQQVQQHVHALKRILSAFARWYYNFLADADTVIVYVVV